MTAPDFKSQNTVGAPVKKPMPAVQTAVQDVVHPGDVVAVVLTSGVSAVYDYRVPDSVVPDSVTPEAATEPRALTSLEVGSFVRVPLGPRSVIGVVWGMGSGSVAPTRLKPLQGVFDAPPLSGRFRAFLSWVADYTMSPLGRVVRMAVSVPEALVPPKGRLGYVLGTASVSRRTKARDAVLAALEGADRPVPASQLAAQAGVSVGVVRTMAAAGVLQAVPCDEAVDPTHERTGTRPSGGQPSENEAMRPTLSPEQARAAHVLVHRVQDAAFHVSVLDGVTGSGKTEVYFEAIEQAVTQGQQVLVLLPEIALTSQWLDRFERRFGQAPGLWHSDVGQGARRRLWRGVAEGGVSVVVGARSALFLPFRDLGLIVVDEEHDGAFKQEEGVLYHGRDMAVVRGQREGVPVILASATPALETMNNMAAGRYERLELPSRHGRAALPDISAINMVTTPVERGRWLAPELVSAMTETIARGEQVMLFLNRRGYAPLTLCRSCGHRFDCPKCSAWLVSHRAHGRLLCHHCGHSEPEPQVCPACHAEESLVACGPGVERVAEEVEQRFPDARMAILTSDTVQNPADVKAIVSAMENQQVDILVGTQIVAKGYHFPMLTLVGVVDADLGLAGGDLRAAERTYHLLQQVAGRAGRATRPGRVMLQTYQPHHPVMQALVHGDRESFYQAEIAARQGAHMPPFTRLVAVIVSGEEQGAVETMARQLASVAPQQQGVLLYGPAPAPMAMLRGRHRWRLLLKLDRRVRAQTVVADWMERAPKNRKVKVALDVDPYSFL